MVACIGPCAPAPAGAAARAAARRAAAAAAEAARSASTSRPTAASTGSSRPTIRASPRPDRSAIRPTTRPLGRIGGGDLPTIAVDPKNENVVYSCSTVFWRTEDGGLTWSAVRGAPGGDDYQKSWINPDQSRHHPRRRRPGRRGVGQSRRVVEQLVHAADGGDVSRHHGQRVPVPRLRRTAGLGIGVRGQPRQRRRDHVPRLASGEHPGVRRSPRPIRRIPTSCSAASARTSRSTTGRPDRQRTVGPDGRASAGRRSAATCARCRSIWSPVDPQRPVLRLERRVEDDRSAATAGRASARDLARQTWDGAGQRRQVRERRDAVAAGHDHRALAVAARRQRALGRHRRRQHPGDDRTAARSGRTSRRRRSSRGRASSTSTRGTSTR